MKQQTKDRIGGALALLLFGGFIFSFIMMIVSSILWPQPKRPETRCVADHTSMDVVALPGGASVGGINVGGGLEVAPRTHCDTIAVFDTLGREIPHTRRADR